MTDMHDEDHDEIAPEAEDTDISSPEEVPLLTEEEPHPDPEATEEFTEELEKIVVEEPVNHKHKVYPLDPEELKAPLKPEELWDEDGTI